MLEEYWKISHILKYKNCHGQHAVGEGIKSYIQICKSEKKSVKEKIIKWDHNILL